MKIWWGGFICLLDYLMDGLLNFGFCLGGWVGVWMCLKLVLLRLVEMMFFCDVFNLFLSEDIDGE